MRVERVIELACPTYKGSGRLVLGHFQVKRGTKVAAFDLAQTSGEKFRFALCIRYCAGTGEVIAADAEPMGSSGVISQRPERVSETRPLAHLMPETGYSGVSELRQGNTLIVVGEIEEKDARHSRL